MYHVQHVWVITECQEQPKVIVLKKLKEMTAWKLYVDVVHFH